METKEERVLTYQRKNKKKKKVVIYKKNNNKPYTRQREKLHG